MRYAIIQDGSRQFRVQEGDVVDVDSRPAEQGAQIEFPVLFLSGDGPAKIGQPLVEGARVRAEVVGPFRGPKVMTHYYRRRKDSHVRRGHRQDYLRVRISAVEALG